MISELENNIVAVERIKEYIDLPSEVRIQASHIPPTFLQL